MEKLISCLIVDDQQSCLNIIQHHIQKYPQLFLKQSTTDPLVARKCLIEGDIELAFIDYDLSTCVGTELLGDIQNSTTHAFIVTGNVSISAKILINYSNCIAIIYKPISYQVFEKNIDALLKKKFN